MDTSAPTEEEPIPAPIDTDPADPTSLDPVLISTEPDDDAVDEPDTTKTFPLTPGDDTELIVTSPPDDDTEDVTPEDTVTEPP
jgi:hypothetical protein